MKRFCVLGILAAVLAVSTWSATPAEAVKWETVQLNWSGSTSDTLFITDEADTQRTVALSTANWDWPSVSGPATAPLVVARVTFVAQVSNAVSDTLRYVVEYSNTAAGKPEVWSYLVGGSLGATDALGNVALLQNSISTTANSVFEGAILADPDASVALGALNVYGATRLRLRVIGDQSGSTPKLSGVRCYISYAKRIITG